MVCDECAEPERIVGAAPPVSADLGVPAPGDNGGEAPLGTGVLPRGSAVPK